MSALAELRAFIAYKELSHEGREEFDRLIAAVLADVDTLTLGALLTDEAVDRALRVYEDEAGPAYMVRSRDILGPVEEWLSMPEGDPERERRLAEVRAADVEAERQRRDLMRRALAAALGG